MVEHERTTEIASTLAGLLAARPKVRLAVLFGSRARRDAGPDSDVDIAVLGQGEDLLEVGAELSLALGLEVDVVSLIEPPIPLLARIVEEGVSLFERPHGAFANWRSRALTELELDLPWYRSMSEPWLRRVAERGL